MRSILYTNHNGVLNDILPNFHSVGSIEKAEIIIVHHDVMENVNFINELHSKGRKVICVSHCPASTSMYNYYDGYVPIADKYFVWGELDYAYSIIAGISDKTVITGSPIFSHKKPRNKQKRTNIVFVPTKAVEDVRNWSISDSLSKYDADVFCKVMPCHDEGKYINTVVSNAGIHPHIDICFDLISKADIIVSNDHSTTFGLMAMACDVPIIFVNNVDIVNKPCSNIYRSAQYETTFEDLHKTIDMVLENDTKQKERKFWADLGGANIENSKEKMLIEIDKFLNE